MNVSSRIIDLTTDPPPDLVLEIDITHPFLEKLPIYASLGIPEVWRHDGTSVAFYRLGIGGYEVVEASTVLPGVTRNEIMRLLAASGDMPRAAWVRSYRHGHRLVLAQGSDRHLVWGRVACCPARRDEAR